MEGVVKGQVSGTDDREYYSIAQPNSPLQLCMHGIKQTLVGGNQIFLQAVCLRQINRIVSTAFEATGQGQAFSPANIMDLNIQSLSYVQNLVGLSVLEIASSLAE